MVSAGGADFAASEIIITEGRRQAVDFSVPYATEGGMFLYRAGEPMPTMVRATSMRIAVMDASPYDFYLSWHGVDPIRFDSYEAAIKALGESRVDAVFCDSCTARFVVLACVQAHGTGVDQADDCTQLVMQYNGPQGRPIAVQP